MAEDKQLIMQLLNMFAQQMQGIGQQRQQASQARAQMAAEQQRMAQQRQQAAAQLTQNAAAQESLNKYRTAEIKGWKLDWQTEKLKSEVNKEAAEGYQNLIAPKQMPETAPVKSATSMPAGTPSGTGKPMYEDITDVIATLKNMGISSMAAQSILQGEQGELPITQKPQPMTLKEQLELEGMSSDNIFTVEKILTERARRETPEKYWKPSTGGGGGEGATAEPSGIDMSVFDPTPTGEPPAPGEPPPESSMIAGYSVDALRGTIQEAIDAGMKPNDIVANLMSDILEEVPLADPNTLSAEIGRLVVEMIGTK